VSMEYETKTRRRPRSWNCCPTQAAQLTRANSSGVLDRRRNLVRLDYCPEEMARHHCKLPMLLSTLSLADRFPKDPSH